MSKKSKLISRLVSTVSELDDLISKLEEESVNVSFFYARGESGKHTVSKSDRLKLANIVEYNVHYDAKNVESNNDKTA